MFMVRKILSYTWLIVSNCFYLLIVLYVFSRLSDRSETIIVAVLGLLYVTIRSIAMTQWIDLTTRFRSLMMEIEAIKSATIAGYETNNDEWEEAEKIVASRQIKIFVVSAFLFLISLVCLWRIFSVL